MTGRRRAIVAAPAEIGYVESSGETWLVRRNGKMYISVSVYPRQLDDAGLADPDAGYSAYPGVLC